MQPLAGADGARQTLKRRRSARDLRQQAKLTPADEVVNAACCLVLERVTFLLAFVGYAGLTATAVIAAHSRLPVRFWRAMALVILLHVSLVWMVRYEWRLADAIRNGYVGFVAFHGALAMIVASIIVAERDARRLVWAAFAVVSLGAIGAVFRYEVVSAYRTPVILIALVGTVVLVRAYWLGRRSPTAA